MENKMDENRKYYLTKYMRRHEMARLLVQYELFKKIKDIKGSIVECGVYLGGGVMTWVKIAETLEPYNFLRKIYGFDTFEGFVSVHSEDLTGSGAVAEVGRLKPEYDSLAEIKECIAEFDKTRLLKHEDKIILIKGDATKTIPSFIENNKHVLVSLLYLDFDLYEPTLLALKEFLPRMPKGSIIAFDELNDPKYPGETQALLEILHINQHRLESLPFEPHISWITL
jgi:hypothetical protein